jgi:hypothetical protein
MNLLSNTQQAKDFGDGKIKQKVMKTLSKYHYILITNIWLQLGWRPPCEVSKNLSDLVPLPLGYGVIWPLPLGMESSGLYN